MKRLARGEWWWESARCTGKWDLFDSPHIEDHRRAAAFCRACPVFSACHEEMLEIMRSPEITLVGTWAGRLFTTRGAESARAPGKRAS